jgi:hypothetical protein
VLVGEVFPLVKRRRRVGRLMVEMAVEVIVEVTVVWR